MRTREREAADNGKGVLSNGISAEGGGGEEEGLYFGNFTTIGAAHKPV